jgi:hypothetical protein
VARSRRRPRRKAARSDARLLRRYVAITPPAGALALTGSAPAGSQDTRITPAAGLIPPEYRSFGEGLARVVDVLPAAMREWTSKIPAQWAPYVFRGLLDGLLDDPRVTAHHRRRLIRARKDAEHVIELLKAAEKVPPRRRGLPPPAPLNPAARDQVLAEYHRRAAGAPKGTHPEIWKALARECGYSNWKQLRRQVRALRRSP